MDLRGQDLLRVTPTPRRGTIGTAFADKKDRSQKARSVLTSSPSDCGPAATTTTPTFNISIAHLRVGVKLINLQKSLGRGDSEGVPNAVRAEAAI